MFCHLWEVGIFSLSSIGLLLLKKNPCQDCFFDNIVLEKEKWFAFEYLNKSALKGIKLCVWGLFQSAPSHGSCHHSKGNHFLRSRSTVLAPQFIFEILEKFSYWQERSERFYWFYLSVMIIWYPINRNRMHLCSNLVKRIVGSLQRIEKVQRSNSLQFVSCLSNFLYTDESQKNKPCIKDWVKDRLEFIRFGSLTCP